MIVLVIFTAIYAVGVFCQDPSRTCPGGFTLFRSSCYAFVYQQQEWEDARKTCKGMSGYLVQIHTEKENHFVQQMVRDHNSTTIWLGADDKKSEGHWFWTHNGKPLHDYNDWDRDEPNNSGDSPGQDCLEMSFGRHRGHWNDAKCYQKKSFICEKHTEASTIG